MHLVRVLNPQYKLTTIMPGQQEVVESGSQRAKMELAGGTGCEPRADRLLDRGDGDAAAARHNCREAARTEPQWPVQYLHCSFTRPQGPEHAACQLRRLQKHRRRRPSVGRLLSSCSAWAVVLQKGAFSSHLWRL
jgi:hypothetical protein